MQSKANSVEAYVKELSSERREVINKLRTVIKESLPDGFEERMSYGMIGYVVPKSLYPPGYHVDPTLPLPFINLASQKNFVSLYHMSLFSDKELLSWFEKAYAERVPTKLNMGKSCVRFKNINHIPYELIAELTAKMSPSDWIALYERQINHDK